MYFPPLTSLPPPAPPLQVEAEASTDSKPIPGFVPRRGAGLPFGILGVSSTEPPARPNMRVDFQFDRCGERGAREGEGSDLIL